MSKEKEGKRRNKRRKNGAGSFFLFFLFSFFFFFFFFCFFSFLLVLLFQSLFHLLKKVARNCAPLVCLQIPHFHPPLIQEFFKLELFSDFGGKLV